MEPSVLAADRPDLESKMSMPNEPATVSVLAKNRVVTLHQHVPDDRGRRIRIQRGPPVATTTTTADAPKTLAAVITDPIQGLGDCENSKQTAKDPRVATATLAKTESPMAGMQTAVGTIQRHCRDRKTLIGTQWKSTTPRTTTTSRATTSASRATERVAWVRQ